MEMISMDHRYTRECERPEYDEKITEWLDGYEARTHNGADYHIALYHNGYIYRSLSPIGLGEFIKTSQFLHELGLVDILGERETFRGYSVVFALPQIKRLRVKGELILTDIPVNP